MAKEVEKEMRGKTEGVDFREVSERRSWVRGGNLTTGGRHYVSF